MASIMATYAQDFATKWELRLRMRDLETFDKLSDQLIALGMTSASTFCSIRKTNTINCDHGI